MLLPEDARQFMDEWKTDSINAKSVLDDFIQNMGDSPKFFAKFVSRPGVSRSLRVMTQPRADGREIVALLDIIDDDPDNRWLSVCFFADMVEDPEDLGDFVPEGLDGRDALCFNYDENDPRMASYIKNRLGNARDKAMA